MRSFVVALAAVAALMVLMAIPARAEEGHACFFGLDGRDGQGRDNALSFEDFAPACDLDEAVCRRAFDAADEDGSGALDHWEYERLWERGGPSALGSAADS